MTEQIGLRKFKLSQQRYKNGAFYLSALMEGKEVKALDGRFILEDGNELTPTKNGFRIPIEKLDELKRAFAGDLRELGDKVLVENRTFRFHVRYVNDKYGEGIDLRKYKTTDKYTGWDRSGIRMKLENVVTLREWLIDLDPQAIDSAQNLFVGKDFGRKEHEKDNESGAGEAAVNPVIDKLLDDD